MLKPWHSRIKLLLAAALFAGMRLATADDLSARAQAVLDKEVAAETLPALTAGIAKDGQIIWVGAAGYSDIENKVKATPDMVHRLASVSKPLTATAAMQLVEQKKLDLDTPLRKYVPSWPEKAEGEILIWHLLSHTSGIRHYAGRENRPTEQYNSLTDALNVFKDRPLAFAPGEQFLYTTYGYTALGAAIEAASGENYGDYMRAHIWQPAGMDHTSLEVKGVDVPNKAKLYRRSSRGPQPDVYDDSSVRYPGGGIQSTADDLLRFAIAFENGKLISKPTMDRMLTIPKHTKPGPQDDLDYALGWSVFDSKDYGHFITHNGGQSGTSTNFVIYLDHHVAVAVLCNLQDASKPVLDTTIALARMAIGLPELAPKAESTK